jgi:1-deoxy-D-xylulose-5-phosphate synthase
MIVDAGRHQLIVTVEDGVRSGGAGSSIADAVADLRETRVSPPVLVLGVPVAYIPHGTPELILAQLGLDGPGIAAAIAKTLPRPNDLDP